MRGSRSVLSLSQQGHFSFECFLSPAIESHLNILMCPEFLNNEVNHHIFQFGAMSLTSSAPQFQIRCVFRQKLKLQSCFCLVGVSVQDLPNNIWRIPKKPFSGGMQYVHRINWVKPFWNYSVIAHNRCKTAYLNGERFLIYLSKTGLPDESAPKAAFDEVTSLILTSPIPASAIQRLSHLSRYKGHQDAPLLIAFCSSGHRINIRAGMPHPRTPNYNFYALFIVPLRQLIKVSLSHNCSAGVTLTGSVLKRATSLCLAQSKLTGDLKGL